MTSPSPNAEGKSPGGDTTWRNSVLQSYRNEEAREIAKVLAELEPGTSSSSKLSLAMRFEDSVFQAATSLEDYKKRLAKRLKKLKKNYRPTAQPAVTNTQSKEQLFLELRTKYAEPLIYITKNAAKAVQDLQERHGQAKATQLKQHTDSIKSWARELGVFEDPKPTTTDLSESSLLKLQQHLEKRVENIRQYVVKHADSDLFLQETLQRKDSELSANAMDIFSSNLLKRIQQLPVNDGERLKTEGIELLQEALEKAQVPVPLPTRNNSNDLPAALLHLGKGQTFNVSNVCVPSSFSPSSIACSLLARIDKMRAASTALLTYITLKDRKITAPRQTLEKVNAIMKEGLEFVNELAEKKILADKGAGKEREGPKLEDAWTKVLELPSLPSDASNSTLPSSPSPTKKRKLNYPLAIKSQVLFRPKRRTPTNLIPALKGKQAKLIRPEPDGYGSHLILDFKAFFMTIYFSPLLVTIRATDDKEMGKSSTSFSGRASWTPLYHGLASRTDLSVWGTKDKTYEDVGRVVEERLRDASTNATHVLRQCFRKHVKDKTQEIEVEILEGSALLEFLQIVRTTFMPNEIH